MSDLLANRTRLGRLGHKNPAPHRLLAVRIAGHILLLVQLHQTGVVIAPPLPPRLAEFDGTVEAFCKFTLICNMTDITILPAIHFPACEFASHLLVEELVEDNKILKLWLIRVMSIASCIFERRSGIGLLEIKDLLVTTGEALRVRVLRV